jgi:hypothetical protein
MYGDLYLGPPQGYPWPLSVPALEAALRVRFPDMLAVVRPSAVIPDQVLSFEVALADGEKRRGTFTSSGVLSLSDGTPEDWADTIAWYLSLLPPETPVIAMVEDDIMAPLPPGMTGPDQIAGFLNSLES